MQFLPPLPAPSDRGIVPAVDYARADLARKIMRRRAELDLFQKDLASLAGIRVEGARRIETGKVAPSVVTIERIERGFTKAEKRRAWQLGDGEAEMTSGIPAAEVAIDERLVRRLLRDQRRDLADLPVSSVGEGWDNVTFRIGADHAMRLPRRQVAVALIEHEQAWLPMLAERLPLATPVPKFAGRSSSVFPWPWSIVPYLPGRTVDLEPLAGHHARPFAEFLRALHQPAPANAPKNPVRGVPLRMRAGKFEERLHRLPHRVSKLPAELDDLWKLALEAPEATKSCWLHGDLHANNILVDNGEISGVIDWGDITAGDVATDLAGVWSLFEEPEARAMCLAAYGATPEQRTRAQGWAVLFGVTFLNSGLADSPRLVAMGASILRRLAADARSFTGL